MGKSKKVKLKGGLLLREKEMISYRVQHLRNIKRKTTAERKKTFILKQAEDLRSWPRCGVDT